MSTLRPAYSACRRLQRRHDPTYFAATSLLPAAVRPAIHALYGFVRTADQIVDGPDRPATPHERRAALDAWESELDLARAGEDAHPCRRRWSTPRGATTCRSTSCAST
jgi:phytoene synthase